MAEVPSQEYYRNEALQSVKPWIEFLTDLAESDPEAFLMGVTAGRRGVSVAPDVSPAVQVAYERVLNHGAPSYFVNSSFSLGALSAVIRDRED